MLAKFGIVSVCLCLQRCLVFLLTAIISFTEEEREAWRKVMKNGGGQSEKRKIDKKGD